jgi:hypothetical protein
MTNERARQLALDIAANAYTKGIVFNGQRYEIPHAEALILAYRDEVRREALESAAKRLREGHIWAPSSREARVIYAASCVVLNMASDAPAARGMVDALLIREPSPNVSQAEPNTLLDVARDVFQDPSRRFGVGTAADPLACKTCGATGTQHCGARDCTLPKPAAAPRIAGDRPAGAASALATALDVLQRHGWTLGLSMRAALSEAIDAALAVAQPTERRAPEQRVTTDPFADRDLIIRALAHAANIEGYTEGGRAYWAAVGREWPDANRG